MAWRELAARDCGKLARQGFWRANRGAGRQRGTDPPLQTAKRDAPALQPAFARRAARRRARFGDESGARRPPSALFVAARRTLSRPAATDRSRGARWALSRSGDQCARSRRRQDSAPAAASSRDTHRPTSLLSRHRNAPELSHQRVAPSGGHRSRDRSTRGRDRIRSSGRIVSEGIMSTPFKGEGWSGDDKFDTEMAESEEAETEWESEFHRRPGPWRRAARTSPPWRPGAVRPPWRPGAVR